MQSQDNDGVNLFDKLVCYKDDKQNFSLFRLGAFLFLMSLLLIWAFVTTIDIITGKQTTT